MRPKAYLRTRHIEIHGDLDVGIPGGRRNSKTGIVKCPRTWANAKHVAIAIQNSTGVVTPEFGVYLRAAKQGMAEAARAITDPIDTLTKPIITKVQPWDHQIRAYHRAVHLESSMIGMDMGSGKTKVALDVICNLRLAKTLVVAPFKVVESEVWPEQIGIHVDANETNIVHGTLDHKTTSARLEEAKNLWNGSHSHLILVVPYQGVWRDPLAAWLMDQNWDLIVLDESHRIKSAGGVASNFLSRLGTKATKRIAMSGTPLAETPFDAYGQYRFLDVGIFGSNNQEFEDRYGVWGGYGFRKLRRMQREGEFRRKFFSIAYIVATEDVIKLPEPINISIKIQMPPATRERYTELDNEYITQINEDEFPVDNALVKFLRLQQLTSGFLGEYDLDTAKIDMLKDRMNDIDPKAPVVIFTRFNKDIERIRQEWKNIGEISGRRNDLAEWKKGKHRMLVVQIQAGSEGIDLRKSRYAIFYSLGMSLKDYMQARRRLLRPGQKKRVMYLHLLVRDSVDEEIFQSYMDKQDVITRLIESRKRRK